SDDTVTIEAGDDALQVECGQSHFRLSISDPAEFPDVPGFTETQYSSIPAAAFKQGIQRTLFAADVESSRYALGGVLLDFAAGGLTLAATDSRRLAVCQVPCSSSGEATGDTQAVVPSKAMSMIERSLGDSEDD